MGGRRARRAPSALHERPETAERDAAELARLRDKLADAEQALRDLRARNRAQVEEYKTENASLRRKLGESRAAERAARDAAAEQERLVEEVRAEAAARSAGQDKELRRLRDRVAQLEAEAAADRRAARSDRDEVTLRARLLLDTVIDAASGLRRELALPGADGAPGDRIEADLAQVAEARAAGAARRVGVAGRAGAGAGHAPCPADRRRLQRQQDRLADLVAGGPADPAAGRAGAAGGPARGRDDRGLRCRGGLRAHRRRRPRAG